MSSRRADETGIKNAAIRHPFADSPEACPRMPGYVGGCRRFGHTERDVLPRLLQAYKFNMENPVFQRRKPVFYILSTCQAPKFHKRGFDSGRSRDTLFP